MEALEPSGAQRRSAGGGCRLEGAPGQTSSPHARRAELQRRACGRAEVSFNETRPAGININNKAALN